MSRPIISASGLAKTIVPIPPTFDPRPKDSLSGKYLHRMLGYTNQKQLVRDYVHYNGRKHIYTMLGTPDLIKGNTLVEFKTGYGESYLEKQIDRGDVQLQVYGYLTGIRNLELHLLNTETSEFRKIEIPYDPDWLDSCVETFYLKKL